jgi:hypothetical protein
MLRGGKMRLASGVIAGQKVTSREVAGRCSDSFDYLFDFATIPLIFETIPTFLAVFLFGFFY